MFVGGDIAGLVVDLPVSVVEKRPVNRDLALYHHQLACRSIRNRLSFTDHTTAFPTLSQAVHSLSLQALSPVAAALFLRFTLALRLATDLLFDHPRQALPAPLSSRGWHGLWAARQWQLRVRPFDATQRGGPWLHGPLAVTPQVAASGRPASPGRRSRVSGGQAAPAGNRRDRCDHLRPVPHQPLHPTVTVRGLVVGALRTSGGGARGRAMAAGHWPLRHLWRRATSGLSHSRVAAIGGGLLRVDSSTPLSLLPSNALPLLMLHQSSLNLPLTVPFDHLHRATRAC